MDSACSGRLPRTCRPERCAPEADYFRMGVLGPAGLGVALESYEIWIQYRTIGLIVPGNNPLLTILGRHGFDVLLMPAGPLLVVVVGAISAK